MDSKSSVINLSADIVDFEIYYASLDSSPLLDRWMVPPVAYAVPLILLVSFTAYFVLLVLYGDESNCSCRGLLERANTSTHLLLNMAFICIAFFLCLTDQAGEASYGSHAGR